MRNPGTIHSDLDCCKVKSKTYKSNSTVSSEILSPLRPRRRLGKQNPFGPDACGLSVNPLQTDSAQLLDQDVGLIWDMCSVYAELYGVTIYTQKKSFNSKLSIFQIYPFVVGGHATSMAHTKKK